MKKKLIALFLMILFMISASGCALFASSKPFYKDPDGIVVYLRDSNHKYLYEYGNPYGYNDESKIPLLSREESYIVEVDFFNAGDSIIIKDYISFVYEEEKLEIIDLNHHGEFILRILEDFEETTVVVGYENDLYSFSCDVLIKMQPNEVI